MTIEATESNAVASETVSSADPDQAVVDFINGSSENETTESEPKTEPEKKPEVPEVPEVKTPEAILAEAEAAKKDALARLEKVNSQIAALERKTRSAQEREAKLVEREKAIQSLDSVSAITAHLAKARGVTADEIWQEWSEEIRNGGKPSDATIAKRERAALQREREELEALKQQKSLEQKNSIAQQWGNDVDGLLGTETAKTSFPQLLRLPKELLATTIIAKAREYETQTGGFPDPSQLLTFLESQFPVATAIPEAPKQPEKKPKFQSLTSRDIDAPPEARNLSEQEREDLAMQYVQGLG